VKVKPLSPVRLFETPGTAAYQAPPSMRFSRQEYWRDKEAFLNDQYKEVEENNRVGKTRDLFKKIRDTEGTFHAKMGTTKDRNGRT